MQSRVFFVVSVIIALRSLARGCEDGTEVPGPANDSVEEDARLDMEGLVRKYGYPVEKHIVQTEDGYLLTMYRIPYGRTCGPGNGTKTSVLLQHGLLSSSFDFVILGPRSALGYILADNCYDVWMGNNRGNGESKKHIAFNSSQKEFWTFSWHEMGKYDVPAMVDHILNVTGRPNIHYVGFSQGTTQFFVFGALRPDYHHKIRSMHALSPVAYMNHLSSPFVKVLFMFNNALETITDMIGMFEMFPSQSFLNFLGTEICKNQYPELQSICCNVMFLLCGFDEPQVNKTLLPAIIAHTPAGAGIKQLMHYAQAKRSGEFRQYSYGSSQNLKIYNSKLPPKYAVEKINVPIAMYYGANDFMASVHDVKKLLKLLPNVFEDYAVPYSKFNHLDFIYGIDSKDLVYYRVVELLDKYN